MIALIFAGEFFRRDVAVIGVRHGDSALDRTTFDPPGQTRQHREIVFG
jgi:hypothetical protein